MCEVCIECTQELFNWDISKHFTKIWRPAAFQSIELLNKMIKKLIDNHVNSYYVCKVSQRQSSVAKSSDSEIETNAESKKPRSTPNFKDICDKFFQKIKEKYPNMLTSLEINEIYLKQCVNHQLEEQKNK